MGYECFMCKRKLGLTSLKETREEIGGWRNRRIPPEGMTEKDRMCMSCVDQLPKIGPYYRIGDTTEQKQMAIMDVVGDTNAAAYRCSVSSWQQNGIIERASFQQAESDSSVALFDLGAGEYYFAKLQGGSTYTVIFSDKNITLGDVAIGVEHVEYDTVEIDPSTGQLVFKNEQNNIGIQLTYQTHVNILKRFLDFVNERKTKSLLQQNEHWKTLHDELNEKGIESWEHTRKNDEGRRLWTWSEKLTNIGVIIDFYIHPEGCAYAWCIICSKIVQYTDGYYDYPTGFHCLDCGKKSTLYEKFKNMRTNEMASEMKEIQGLTHNEYDEIIISNIELNKSIFCKNYYLSNEGHDATKTIDNARVGDIQFMSKGNQIMKWEQMPEPEKIVERIKSTKQQIKSQKKVIGVDRPKGLSKFCLECGIKLVQNSKFCGNCGTKIQA